MNRQRYERILDALEEHLENAPDDELLDDARQEGRDPAETAARLKGVLKNALKTFQKENLRAD